MSHESISSSMSPIDLDRFDLLYTNRVKGMRSAAPRDLMATLSQSDLISLAGGFPDTTIFREEVFQEIFTSLTADSARALQYGPTAGLDWIRGAIVDIMAAEGTPARQEDICITTGAQQGLDLVGRVFLEEGDAVLCEGPTYCGALNAFSSYRPRIIHVPMDQAGMIPVAAREALSMARRHGTNVKFIYTVPNFQNPAGVTLAAERRQELLKIGREYNLVIVEDNPYGMLRFEGEALPTLSALEQEYGEADRVVYLGSFSKIFAPGVRLGWVHAHPAILHKINVAKQGADLCSSNLSQMLTYYYLQRNDWRASVRRLTALYKERRNAMLDALTGFMPQEVHWNHPEGGLFVWVTLPSYIDATAMLPKAVARNVAYVPGESFYAHGEGKNCMRLSFSFVESKKIRHGIELLADIVREHIEIRKRPTSTRKSAAKVKKAEPAVEQAAALVVASPADGEQDLKQHSWETLEALPGALRAAMGLFPTGVTIVTTGRCQAAEGMTANAVISVSLEPLLFLVSVHKEARLNRRIKEEGYYAVNLLAADQEDLSQLFASPERSSGLFVIDSLGGGYGQTGAPLAAGALAAIECELEAVYPGGDHDLFLGRVVAVHRGDECKGPLVFHKGSYPTLNTAPRLGDSASPCTRPELRHTHANKVLEDAI